MNPYAPPATDGTPLAERLRKALEEHFWILFVIAWAIGRAILDASDQDGLRFWQNYCPSMMTILRSESAVLLGYLLVYCTTWIWMLGIALGLGCGMIIHLVRAIIWVTKLIFRLATWISTSHHCPVK